MSPLAANLTTPTTSADHHPAFGYELPVTPTPGPPAIEALYYTDPQGNETDLSTIMDEQYKEGMDGRFTPQVQHFADVVPEQDGARYRGTRVLPGQITVPLTLVANDITTLRAKVRQLAQALNPKRGVGTLTCVTEDGVSRYINCVLESGMETDPATEGEQYDARVVLTFRAFDPFWYDLLPVRKTFQLVTAPATFFPILPVRLGASAIFSTFTENNEGDTYAWPVWRIAGPGEAPVLRNETTGEQTAINATLTSNGVITIDTRPGVKSVTAGETNLFDRIRGTLWPLVAGENVITVEFLGTSPSSDLRLEYRARFLGV